MNTDTNESIIQKPNFKGIVLNDDFIGYINTLSDSIKEFYKVSKNVNKNINILLNLAGVEMNNTESVINTIIQEQININSIYSINGVTERLRDILNKLQMNIISEKNNINYFFEDAKLLFKKMKEKRQQLIKRIKRRSNSASKNNNLMIFPASHCNTDVSFRKIKADNEKMNKSEVNCNIRNIKNSTSDYNYAKKTNNNPMQKKGLNTSRKSKTVNKLYEKDDFFDKNETDYSTYKNQNISTSRLIDTKSQNVEIEKLKILNRKLCLELKKCKSKTLECRNNALDNSLNNDMNNINMVIQDKEKTISSLKDELNKNNKKNMELINNINNYKLELKKMKEENNKLKQQIQNNRKNNNNIKELNNLIKENKILKNNADQFKENTFNACSEYNTNLGLLKNDLNLEYNNGSGKNVANELLKKKINLLEKKLNEKLLQNKELNNKSITLKNKLESEISKLSNKNSELSTNLINMQNEYLALKKESINKTKELENLKVSLNEKQKHTDSANKINIEKSNNLYHSIGNENFNKIIDNYKKENEQLKNNNNIYQDKIKFYQTQIRNIKNELYEKNQANIELENNNENKIKEIKDNYEKKIMEVNSKNKILEKNFEESQNINCDLSQQICNLNEQIVAKDVKILELNYKIEQLQKQLEELKKQINKDIHNNSNEHIKKLNEQLEEQQNLNNDLNEELLNIKNDNELLKNKIMSNEKKLIEFKNKGNKNVNDINILNKEIENLKNENIALKSSNEKLTIQLKNVLDNNNINNINDINKDDAIKKQKEEIEGFKQLINKLQKEREKSDADNNTLKRENEKIKNQLIRLSKTLPEEYNELQKQYNELENKYMQNVKNKNSINTTPTSKKQNHSNSDSKITVEEQLTKELNIAKKEIETIKKKNADLIKQLEEKDIKKNCYDNKSEDGNKSNYEEEFDLRKMAKGARDKNRSQDINIDYPGVQAIKEKYRELDFFYNSLEGLVKKLLLTIQCNPKNKTYVTEICRIVGFDMETTNKIVTNKNKKLLLGLFTK